MPKRTVAERFWAKVVLGPVPEYAPELGNCWVWIACTFDGYGRFWPHHHAHRWAYEHSVGPIPEGLELDHLCRVRRCVRPSHLEAVTPSVNVRRSPGLAPASIHAAQTHCKHGHVFDAENTYVHPRTGWRSCRACQRARWATKHHAAGPNKSKNENMR